MMKLLPKKRTPSTVLGLALDAGRLEGVLLRRTNGSLQVLKRFTAALALNPLNGAPELVGREIQNHLEQAGVREKRCVVCVPLAWALAVPVRLPALPEEDVPGFLEIEAERSLPYSPDALSLVTSRCRPSIGEQQATLVAIPRHSLQQLEMVFKAAQLRPVSFSLGITALQGAEKESASGVVALYAGETAIELQVSCHGGVAALRSLQDVVESEGARKEIDADLLTRELRITLGQMPDTLRGEVRKVRVFGAGDLSQRLAQDLVTRAATLGLQVESVRTVGANEFRSKPPADTVISPALSLAARWLTDVPTAFEFLPPKVSAFRQLTARFSSRKLGWITGAAAAVFLFAGGAIAIQQWQLSQLQSRWSGMAPQVTELEGMQQQIRRFRPWFDETFRSLSILRRVTEAFPADGVVTARLLEIREQSTVTCSGVARDNQAFLKMLDQLRSSKEVGNVKVDQVRGKTPLQFTLNFQWAQGGAGE